MKRLIFRLSSLGDVILAQSALEPSYSGETHWVVAREFEALLVGNPSVHRVWSFDRKKERSLRAWFELLRQLGNEGFDEVLDLHSTLRTRIAAFYFRWMALRGKFPRVRWKTLTKGRVRRLGYLLGKGFWPKPFRPRHLSALAARLAGGNGTERANLQWLAEKAQRPVLHHEDEILVAIAPSSAWREKEWPAEKYVDLVERLRATEPRIRILLFGAAQDPTAIRVRGLLLERRAAFEDFVGVLELPEVAKALSQCDFVVGPDTGLIHLSEAVGTPAVVLYGPTRNDFGFGPSRPESRAVHGPVRCSPCSKDGTLCYRIGDRYACLKKMRVETVLDACMSMIRRAK